MKKISSLVLIAIVSSILISVIVLFAGKYVVPIILTLNFLVVAMIVGMFMDEEEAVVPVEDEEESEEGCENYCKCCGECTDPECQDCEKEKEGCITCALPLEECMCPKKGNKE